MQIEQQISIEELKALSIVMANDNPEEVVDTIADFGQVVVIIERPLADGFQYTDLFAWVATQPYIQEILNDAQIFWTQFNEIVAKNPTLAISSVIEARNRVESGSGSVTTAARFFFNFLYLAANGFNFGSFVFVQSQQQLGMWQNFFKGVDIMPQLPPAGA